MFNCAVRGVFPATQLKGTTEDSLGEQDGPAIFTKLNTNINAVAPETRINFNEILRKTMEKKTNDYGELEVKVANFVKSLSPPKKVTDYCFCLGKNDSTSV